MEEQLIEFETAKLAKEKGCELTSDYGYGWTYEKDVGNIEKVEFMDKCEIRGVEIQETPNGLSNYYAPTQSLLQKWLREKHKIHLDIETLIKAACYVYSWNILYEIETVHNKSSKIPFFIYEESLEKGLQESLKLLP